MTWLKTRKYIALLSERPLNGGEDQEIDAKRPSLGRSEPRKSCVTELVATAAQKKGARRTCQFSSHRRRESLVLKLNVNVLMERQTGTIEKHLNFIP